MKSFQLIYILSFLIFYGIIGWGALKNLMNIYHPKYSASVKRTFFIQTLLLIFFFIFLYIYPNHPRQANNYKFQLIFNVIFFIDFIIKLLLAISFLCYFFFRKNQKSKIILLAGAIISIWCYDYFTIQYSSGKTGSTPQAD